MEVIVLDDDSVSNDGMNKATEEAKTMPEPGTQAFPPAPRGTSSEAVDPKRLVGSLQESTTETRSNGAAPNLESRKRPRIEVIEIDLDDDSDSDTESTKNSVEYHLPSDLPHPAKEQSTLEPPDDFRSTGEQSKAQGEKTPRSTREFEVDEKETPTPASSTTNFVIEIDDDSDSDHEDTLPETDQNSENTRISQKRSASRPSLPQHAQEDESEENDAMKRPAEESQSKIDSFLESVYGFSSLSAGGPTTREDNQKTGSTLENADSATLPAAESSSDDEVEIIEGPVSKRSSLFGDSNSRRATKPKRFKPVKPKKKGRRVSHSAAQNTAKQRGKGSATTTTTNKASERVETRYVFSTKQTQPPEISKKDWEAKNYNANLSREDALREQERLFRESAARIRSQAKVHVRHGGRQGCKAISFQAPVPEIHKKHPEHWKFQEPYARLGLPVNSPTKLVKTHYRYLARVYHPDKSQSDCTSAKFQAIAEAYKCIVDS